MSGHAVFSGSTYQQKVAAFVAVHIIGRRPLFWFGAEADTPVAYSAETNGPGDDIAVSLDGPTGRFEIQAKHGLVGGVKFKEAIETILAKQPSKGQQLRVVIAVDESTSRTVRLENRDDLERLRTGRTDHLKKDVSELLAGGAVLDGLRSVYVRHVDVDSADGPDLKVVLAFLADALEDPSQASTAWNLLVEDAGTVCAKRLGRPRADLLQLLEHHKIRVKPAGADEHRRLDDCKELIKRWHLNAARDRLAAIEGELAAAPEVDVRLRYRVLQLRAQCELQAKNFSVAAQLASRALEIDPEGLEALRAAGFSYLQSDNLAKATACANKAIAAHPNEERAWVLSLQVEAAAGRKAPLPPPPVSDGKAVKLAQAQIASNRGDWDAVIDITSSLLASGIRDPDVLIQRAEAHLQHSALGPERLDSVVQMATDVLDAVSNDNDPHVEHALFLRSIANAQAGNTQAAEADNLRLRERGTFLPDAVRNAAVLRCKAGDLEGAVGVLYDPGVDKDARLLSFRARLQLDRGNADAARSDANAALALLGQGSSGNDLVAVSEALLHVGKTLEARGLLSDPRAVTAEGAMYHVLRGRLSFSDGDPDSAEGHFERAAAADEPQRRQIQLELAFLLRRGGLSSRACDVMAKLPKTSLEDHELSLYCQCLVDCDRLKDVQALLEDRLKKPEPPLWARTLAFDIAIRREDVDGAIRLFSRDDVQQNASTGSRLQLGRLLYEANRPEESKREARAVLERKDLAPLEKMQAAVLLAHLRESRMALAVAFQCFREARHDPQMHDGLIGVSVLTQDAVVDVEVVGPDTFVKLSRSGATRGYTILSSEPIDPTRHEMTVSSAAELGLIGKRVADTVMLSDGLDPEEWIVEEILTAAHRAVQDVFEHYNESFPGRKTLIKFNAPTGASVADILPLIRIVRDRKQREEELVKATRKFGLPLGFLCTATGRDLPGVFDLLRPSDRTGGVPAEPMEPEKQALSLHTASSAKEVVLTRSALEVLQRLDMLGLAKTHLVLLAPRTLLFGLEEELRSAEALVVQGRASFHQGDAGLAASSVPAGHPALLARRDRIAGLVEWCRENVDFRPRPLEWIKADGQTDPLREQIGADSWDALELAHSLSVPLYADDLGLRTMPHLEQTVESFSTVAFVRALADKRLVSADQQHRLLHALLVEGLLFVPIDPATLHAAIARKADLDAEGLQRVFSGLAMIQKLTTAAAVLARTLKMAATADILALPLGQITRLALDAMLLGWPAPLIVRVVRFEIAREFVLLPRELREIEAACGAFARANAPQ